MAETEPKQFIKGVNKCHSMNYRPRRHTVGRKCFTFTSMTNSLLYDFCLWFTKCGTSSFRTWQFSFDGQVGRARVTGHSDGWPLHPGTCVHVQVTARQGELWRTHTTQLHVRKPTIYTWNLLLKIEVSLRYLMNWTWCHITDILHYNWADWTLNQTQVTEFFNL